MEGTFRNGTKMDQISAINVFVHVAQARSFVAAGRALGLSASAIGKNIARLEDRLGVRLLNRSTRSVALTPEGVLYLERSRRILAEIELADAELSQTAADPIGLLRISLPMVGDLFLETLTEFKRKFPLIELDIDFSNRQVDLIEEGVDVVIRSGDAQDSRLLTRKIGDFRQLVVGSPNYFAKAGVPKEPQELEGHSCLHLRMPLTGRLQQWRFKDVDDGTLELGRSLVCNDNQARVAFAEAGLGVAYLPDFSVSALIEQGRLVSVLDDYTTGGGTFRALWPSGRHLTPKVRAFIDFMAENLIRKSELSDQVLTAGT
jgi:DNA-binding transcriptional LysR family regulator